MSSDFDFFENRHRKIGAHHEKNGNRKIPDSAAKRYRGNQKKEFERADFPYSGLTCCSNSYVRSMRYSVAYCSEKNIQLYAPMLAPYPVGLCGLPVRA